MGRVAGSSDEPSSFWGMSYVFAPWSGPRFLDVDNHFPADDNVTKHTSLSSSAHQILSVFSGTVWNHFCFSFFISTATANMRPLFKPCHLCLCKGGNHLQIVQYVLIIGFSFSKQADKKPHQLFDFITSNNKKSWELSVCKLHTVLTTQHYLYINVRYLNLLFILSLYFLYTFSSTCSHLCITCIHSWHSCYHYSLFIL